MVNRNTSNNGTDWGEEGLKPSDLNDTFDATIIGINAVLVDSAITANAANTFNLPTNRTWKTVKVYITIDSGSTGNITLFRINGNSGASDYVYHNNLDSTTTVNLVTTDEIGVRSSTLFTEGGTGVCDVEMSLVNDKVMFSANIATKDTQGFGNSRGFMDTVETDITSISFTVGATFTGRIKIVGWSG